MPLSQHTRVLGALAPVVLVLGGLASALAVVHAAAREVAGPPFEQRFESVAALERAVGTRLRVPRYFPSSVTWPPSEVRLEGRSPRVALLAFASTKGRPPLRFAQTVGEGTLPEETAPPGLVTLRAQVPLGGVTAQLTRTRAEDGTQWHQLHWRRGERDFVLQSPGGLEELLKLASSVQPVEAP